MKKYETLRSILNEDINIGIDVHNYSHIMIDFENPPNDIPATSLYIAPPDQTPPLDEPAYIWRGSRHTMAYAGR